MYDPKHFDILAGQEALESYKTKIAAVMAAGADLPTAQTRAWGEGGFRDAEIVKSMYGFSVRSGSGLDGWRFIAGRRQGWTFEQAVAAAKTWQAEDPSRRYVWVRKSALAD